MSSSRIGIQHDHIFRNTLFILFQVLAYVNALNEDNLTSEKPIKKEGEGILLVGWNIHEISNYLTWTLFIILVIFFKFVFHNIPLISSIIPESCILIALGSIFGVLVDRTFSNAHLKNFHIDPQRFFFVLLPPIILEASFNLYNRNFGKNLSAVLLFAVVGTIINFVFIGLSLWGLGKTGAYSKGNSVTLLQSLLFSSVIVAVDPVAVLAIFQEIGVDQTLYFLVFGEALLNDAVTVVLYDIIIAMIGMEDISLKEIFLGVASFFSVSIGALLVGCTIGSICCIFTRYTSSTPVLEPLIIFSFGYFSYIVGDLFNWSGIISMIGCGVIQAAYAFNNISETSLATVHRLAIMSASISEALIFLFLGVELFAGKLEFNPGFMLLTLFLCLISRALVTAILSFTSNHFNLAYHKISWAEQFILTYGGLRGAVAFSLATLIEEKNFPKVGITKKVINTTTLFIILFTVGVMGITMKPIVKLLNIRLEPSQPETLMAITNEFVIDRTVSGVISILGSKEASFLGHFNKFNKKYIRFILLKNSNTSHEKILDVYKQMFMDLHFSKALRSSRRTKRSSVLDAFTFKGSASFDDPSISDQVKRMNIFYEPGEAENKSDYRKLKQNVNNFKLDTLIRTLHNTKYKTEASAFVRTIHEVDLRRIFIHSLGKNEFRVISHFESSESSEPRIKRIETARRIFL